jgi:catechol 2,3-dioxygenase-like lactoylglutathione lyase family enzyme
VLKIAIPVLHVRSSEAAEQFYCGKLGFQRQFVYRPFDDRKDPCYMGLTRDRAELHVSSFSGDSVCGTAVYLLVDDVNALHEELRGKVTIDTGPVDQSWGNREMYVKDPDGNSIRFTQPLG